MVSDMQLGLVTVDNETIVDHETICGLFVCSFVCAIGGVALARLPTRPPLFLMDLGVKYVQLIGVP